MTSEFFRDDYEQNGAHMKLNIIRPEQTNRSSGSIRTVTTEPLAGSVIHRNIKSAFNQCIGVHYESSKFPR